MDTLTARGTFDVGTRGRATFAPAYVILGVTKDQVLLGTRTVDESRALLLEEQFSHGRFGGYDLRPYRVAIEQASTFDLGKRGRVGKILERVVAGFRDFAVQSSSVGLANPFFDDPFLGGFASAADSPQTNAGTGSAWVRATRTVQPPRGARYAVPRARLTDMVDGKQHYLDSIQVENRALGESIRPFVTARSIKANVRPTRLNLSQNPGFKNDTSNWVLPGTGTPFRDTAYKRTGAASYKVTLANQTNVVKHTVGDLRSGRRHLVSIWISFGNGEWIRLNQELVPQDSTATVTFVPPTASSYPRTMWVDGVLVEESNGEYGTYFDGDSGYDFLWEQGSTPGNARSYFYEDRANRHYLLMRSLQENVPVGVFVDSPEYAVRPPAGPRAYGSGAYGSGPYGV